MSSLTKDYDNQSSNFILLIWGCGKVDRRVIKGNKDRWYCGLCGNEYNIWNYTKALMHMTGSGGHSIDR